MKQPKLHRALRVALSLLLMAACCAQLLSSLFACRMVLNGNILVQLLSGGSRQSVLLQGSLPLDESSGTAAYLALNDTIFVHSLGPDVTAGVTAIGLLKHLPRLVLFAVLLAFLLQVARGRAASRFSRLLLFWGGLLLTALPILLPAVNGWLIPALVNYSGETRLALGVDLTSCAQACWGLGMLLLSNVLFTAQARASI